MNWLSKILKRRRLEDTRRRQIQNSCKHKWERKRAYVKAVAQASLLSILFGDGAKIIEVEDEYWFCLKCDLSRGYVETD